MYTFDTNLAAAEVSYRRERIATDLRNAANGRSRRWHLHRRGAKQRVM